jgi:hypothetical protein
MYGQGAPGVPLREGRVTGETAAPQAAGPGEGPGPWEEAGRELAALTADYGSEYEFGFDRSGWDAWPHLPYRDALHADDPAALREKVRAALGQAAEAAP